MDSCGDDVIAEHARQKLAKPYPQATTTKNSNNDETVCSQNSLKNENEDE